MSREALEALGWVCAKCSCPGGNGLDCVNIKYRGVVIQQRGLFFRLVRNSLVIESGNAYQLKDKLIMHGLNA